MVAKRLVSRPAAPGGSVLLVSFRHRDPVSEMLTQLGCRVTAVRRAARLDQRLAKSNAGIIIVDVREAVDEGIKAIQTLAPMAEDRGLPLIALYERNDEAQLAQAVEAGASMVLAAPFSAAELSAEITLSGRVARRAAGLRLPPQLRQDANRDGLTGLHQSPAFSDWISQSLPSAPVSLIRIKVARFDMINDAFGTDTGDAALRALAHRIEPLVDEMAGSDGLFARLPGAEFAVALRGNFSAARLHLLAEAISEAIARPFSGGEELVRLGCRIGIVQSVASDRAGSTMLRRAADALAETAVEGSAPIRLLIGADAEVSTLARSLHADLRAALIRDEIEILYQPQVGTSSGRIEGVEALARWHHPVHGEIGAATLFAVAEQSDYLLQLSAHIQRQAVDEAAQWPETLANLRLAINVTASDIARPRFVRNFLSTIDHSGFPRERLTVEVTESGLMGNLEAANKIFAQLRQAGCRIAIDDFGTGYSSLAYLNALPADYLKIDKGLAADIAGSERASLVVRGVIAMAHSLGLSVIAEGVETEGMLAMLAREGCSLYQGYLCAPALTSADLEKLVLARA
jgi:diguanylate cyclase (GGDEF)-like protein